MPVVTNIAGNRRLHAMRLLEVEKVADLPTAQRALPEIRAVRKS